MCYFKNPKTVQYTHTIIHLHSNVGEGGGGGAEELTKLRRNSIFKLSMLNKIPSLVRHFYNPKFVKITHTMMYPHAEEKGGRGGQSIFKFSKHGQSIFVRKIFGRPVNFPVVKMAHSCMQRRRRGRERSPSCVFATKLQHLLSERLRLSA